MTAPILGGLTLALGLVIFWSGLVKLLYVPLALWFAATGRRKRRAALELPPEEEPLVSVVVPAYNEEAVLGHCVESILASRYRNLEVILVDDGSSDRTWATMQELASRYGDVTCISQPNSGKGAALNRGLRSSRGEILLFVDADGVFTRDTVHHMVAPFRDPRVGAVSGDDRPVNLDNPLTRLLALISHVGTGLVRRALSTIHCLPIVSGNSGAFRREALEAVGPMDTTTVGEDLELTWRMHRHGFRVRFAPSGLVYAESPSTLRGLWRQRVRWARGLLQVTRIHRGMIGNPRYRAFGLFLVVNTVTMIVVPVLQVVALLLLVPLQIVTRSVLPETPWDLVLWLGLGVALLLLLVAIALNRAFADLRHLWALPLWPLYSLFVTSTLVWAVVLELRGRPARWDKLRRTGVVSIAR